MADVSDKKEKNEQEESIFWQAPEYIFYEKTTGWYLLSIVAALVLIVIALWQKNFLFAVFVVVAELVFVSVANMPAKIWHFSLDDDGLHIFNGPSYELGKTVTAFDVHDLSDEFKELVLEVKKRAVPFVKVLIYPEDEERIVARISKKIPRKEIGHSLVESFSHLIRF